MAEEKGDLPILARSPRLLLFRELEPNVPELRAYASMRGWVTTRRVSNNFFLGPGVLGRLELNEK